MLNRGIPKAAKQAAVAVLLGSVCLPALMASQAKADFNTDQIIRNVIQNILEDVRDQIQRRRLLPPPTSRIMRFSGEDANSVSNSDDPFSALAYNKIPTKAPPMVAPQPQWLYGANLTGSGDESRSSAAGSTIVTRSVALTGAVDITKIGITTPYDALTVVFTGSGVWGHSFGLDSDTGVGAGTIAYVNGGFSTDFTIDGTWTKARLAANGIVVASSTDSSGVSYAPNFQYKFELQDKWFIEPTIGVTYTQAFAGNFGAQISDSTEVHGGARFGTETMWDTVRVQPQLTLAAFSIVSQTIAAGAPVSPSLPAGIGGSAGTGVPTGAVGGRASGKLNFLWTDKFSSFIEAHGSTITNNTAYGASGGVRWTF